MHRLSVSFVLPLAIFFGLVMTPDHSFAQFRDWNTGTGDWSVSANWNPNLVPGVTEIARIGLLPAVHSEDVHLDVHTVIGGLQIYDGMSLHTNGGTLTTVFDTLVTGNNERSSELRVISSSFNTRNLTNEAQVTLLAGSANVSGVMNNAEGSRLVGNGNFNLTGDVGIVFRNDGMVYSNSASPLSINQLGDGLMDLDGSTGNGSLVAGPHSAMTFNGTQLADSFSGSIRLQYGDTLSMNFSEGWTADANSEITLGRSGSASPTVIQGGNWIMQGSLVAEALPLYDPGMHVIESATVLGSQSNVLVQLEETLAFNGPVTLDGGEIVLQEDAEVSFNSNTLVNGGTFATHSELGVDGTIAFNGLTAWQGDVSISGNARQNGTALVTGNTTINADIFDMDGLGSTNWNVTSALTVNAEGIDSTLSNSFDGTMNVQGGISSSLNIDLGIPDQHWTMAGEMNLSNALALGVYRLHGSEMRVTGDLNIEGQVGATADVTFDNSAVVSFANSDSSLFVGGKTRVGQNATLLGEGTLQNLLSGELTLADGATLDHVDVINQGVFRIGNSAGIASLDNLELLSEGTWDVEIGGYLSGDEFDHLLVGGDALLDGFLSVNFIDSGFGVFAPEVGDEFSILSSVGGVNGVFNLDPVTFSGGREYQWEVLYNAHNVTLRVASVSVPEPAATGVLLVAMAGLCFKRRRVGTALPTYTG